MIALPRVVRRLADMDAAEITFRTLTGARREAERLGQLIRRPSWKRRDLAGALNPDVPEVARAARCLDAGQWRAAEQCLAGHFATRPPRFVLQPDARAALRRAICERFPEAPAHAAAAADRVAAGRFDLLGYRSLRFSGSGDHPEDAPGAEIDWHLDPVHGRRAPLVHWSRVPYLDPACGDHKIIWELNRHQFWLALGRAWWLTGDARYRAAFVAQLHGWLAANPPLIGINWASMLELGLRSLSWIWALHFFCSPAGSRRPTPLRRGADIGSADAAFSAEAGEGSGEAKLWVIDLLLGLDRQLRLVERNLSRYFSPNTHLTGEALALYVAGRTMPELRRAAGWARLGRTVLVEEAGRQINADGGHAELSTHYHRYTLDFYLLALVVARATGDRSAPVFAETVRRLGVFARALADRQGRLPAIGDEDAGTLFPLCGREASDVTDSLQLAAALLGRPDLAVGRPAEEVLWMTAGACDEPEGSYHRRSASASSAAGEGRYYTGSSVWRSTALPVSGYYVSRTRRGDHLIIEAGPHGFHNGAHAHADALSLTLTVADRPFLIDPGTGCYTVDAEVRDRFRSTRFHNTLTLDGRSQSIPEGPFHWRSTCRAVARTWRSNRAFDYFEGFHDGYRPVEHHRAVLARPGCWLIVDWVFDADEPEGSYHRHRRSEPSASSSIRQADLHWHLDPAWRSDLPPGGAFVRAVHPDGRTVWLGSAGGIVEIFHGATDGTGLGWCALRYGPLTATTTIRTRLRRPLPFAVLTVLLDAGQRDQPPVLERLEVEGAAPAAMGVRLRTGDWSEIIVWAPPLTPVEGGRRGPWRADGFESDARMACWRETPDGRFGGLWLVDGCLAGRAGCPPAVARSRPASDLYLPAERDVSTSGATGLAESRA